MAKFTTEHYRYLKEVDKYAVRNWLIANKLDPNRVAEFTYTPAALVAVVYVDGTDGKIRWDEELGKPATTLIIRKSPLAGYVPECLV